MKYFKPSELRNFSAVMEKIGADRGLILDGNEPVAVLMNITDFKSTMVLLRLFAGTKLVAGTGDDALLTHHQFQQHSGDDYCPDAASTSASQEKRPRDVGSGTGLGGCADPYQHDLARKGRIAMSKRLPREFRVRTRWDASDSVFVAQCEELPNCIGYSEDAAEALRQAYEAVEDHLAAREELGLPLPEQPQKEYSGKLLVRVSKRLHRMLAESAAEEGLSLNQHINGIFNQWAGACGVSEGSASIGLDNRIQPAHQRHIQPMGRSLRCK